MAIFQEFWLIFDALLQSIICLLGCGDCSKLLISLYRSKIFQINQNQFKNDCFQKLKVSQLVLHLKEEFDFCKYQNKVQRPKLRPRIQDKLS